MRIPAVLLAAALASTAAFAKDLMPEQRVVVRMAQEITPTVVGLERGAADRARASS